MKLHYGFEGWQMVFIVIGVLTIPGAIGMLYFVQDPMNDPELKKALCEDDLELVFPGLETDSSEAVNLSLKVIINLYIILNNNTNIS